MNGTQYLHGCYRGSLCWISMILVDRARKYINKSMIGPYVIMFIERYLIHVPLSALFTLTFRITFFAVCSGLSAGLWGSAVRVLHLCSDSGAGVRLFPDHRPPTKPMHLRHSESTNHIQTKTNGRCINC